MTDMEPVFFQKLERRVKQVNSLLCIGLDPHPQHISEPTAAAAFEFCSSIINATHEYAAAFKPNAAFFESLGAEGVVALTTLTEIIKSLDIPIILDVKRGDIGSTAEHYALAAYDVFGADAVTLSPYMGWDSIKPFVGGRFSRKGAFLLCKTSNPSSADIQDLHISSGETVYEKVGDLCNRWNESNGTCLGLVAGATDIPSLKAIRSTAPAAWLLCPGVGAQGGSAEAVCDAGLRPDGGGVLVAVSRGISDPAGHVGGRGMGDLARELRDQINQCRDNKRNQSLEDTTTTTKDSCGETLQKYQKEFIELSIDNTVLRFGSFTLKSGRVSPYFFNAGLFCGGRSMHALCRYYAQAIHAAGVEFEVFFGPAYKGIPLASGVAAAWYQLYGEDKGFAYNRKEMKDHGEGGVVVGSEISGKRVLIVDDVITAGTAIRESMGLLKEAGAAVVAVVVALDREETAGVGEELSAVQQVETEFGISVVSIVRLTSLVQFMMKQVSSATAGDSGAFSVDDLNRIEEYRNQYGVNKF